MRRQREEGRILVLSIGFAVLIMLVIFGTASVSTLYLQQKQLVAAADTLGSSSTQSVSASEYYQGRNPGRPVLSRQLVRARVMRQAKAEFALRTRLRRPRVLDVDLPEPELARVHLSAQGELRFLPPALRNIAPTVRLNATSTARIVSD